MPYRFKRYVNGQEMAERVVITHAASEQEAREKAWNMYKKEARPGEMERTRLVLCSEAG